MPVNYKTEHNSPHKKTKYNERLAAEMYIANYHKLTDKDELPQFFIQISSAGNVNKEKKKPPIVRRKRKDAEGEVFALLRPPAAYTNRTREEIINYYLNQDI